MYIALLLFALLLAPASPVKAIEPSENAYLAELIDKGLQDKLASEQEWHLLLHYREDLFGGYTSEQDDPGFFMSPDGKTDPQAELDATLKQFFSDELVGRRISRLNARSSRGMMATESMRFDEIASAWPRAVRAMVRRF